MSIEAIKRVEIAIQEIRRGKMIIMMDDEDRENEGDLVYSASLSTPELVNFMAKEARGLICTPVTRELALELELMPMVEDNVSNHETAFTVSIDSTTASTGISASERNDCISKLASPQSKSSDFVRPGHIFPLIAKDGGTLVRTGHTEGSIDICRLAGLAPISVICEIIKDNGEMARMDDLEIFSKKHDMPIVYISDIVEYRLRHEKLVSKVSVEEVEFFGAEAKQLDFADHLGRTHSVICYGSNVGKTTNVKFHNISVDKDLLIDSSRYNALIRSIEYLKTNNGVLVFLDTKSISKEQAREFGVGAQILKELGIRKINLLTRFADTEFVGLGGFGLDIVEYVRLEE